MTQKWITVVVKLMDFSRNLLNCIFLMALEVTFSLLLQRHDIIKKRIDAHGNVIETRPDTIGAPKVSQ